MINLNQENQVLVRVDLFGTGDTLDMWEGLILNKNKQEIQEIYEAYPIGGAIGRSLTFEEHLKEYNVEFQTLKFAIDHLEPV